MDSIHTHLVTDEQGRPVSVVIPYLDWLKIERLLQDSPLPSTAQSLDRHVGVIRLHEDPLAYQHRSRNEWP